MEDFVNEVDVHTIYSQYKRTRDLIDSDVYMALRARAREEISLREREHEIQQIKKMALNARATTLAPRQQVENEAAAKGLEPAGISAALNKLRQSFVQLNPAQILSPTARGMSLAAGVAALGLGFGLLGGDLFNSRSSSDFNSEYAVEVFSGQTRLVDRLVLGNQEWQYGFSASTGAPAKAFQAGELTIDLSVLSQQSIETSMLSEQILQRLQIHAPYAEELPSDSSLSNESFHEIQAKLAQHYEGELGQQQMFRFGQWVEFHYLLSLMSENDGQVGAYQQYQTKDKQIPAQLETYLVKQNLLAENDIANVHLVAKEDLTLEEIMVISNLLMKIKSVLSYG